MTARLLALLCVLAGATACAWSQAPIERREPARQRPAVLPIQRWPATGSLAQHRKLIVRLDSDFGVTHLCRLRRLDDDGVECEARHHQSTMYPREDIRSIAGVTTRIGFGDYVLGAAAVATFVGLAISSGGLFLVGLVVECVAFPAVMEQEPNPLQGRLIYLAP